MQPADHWENVYRSKSHDAVSWFAPHLDDSLQRIEELCPDRQAAIVDIGGGESTLVDDLLDLGYTDLSVLDLSATAIEFTRSRLGSRGHRVNWHVGDVTQYDFSGKAFDLWHDRAVFHFLTDPQTRANYVALVRRSVKPGGVVLMATFGPDGPLQCSGLSVMRYDEQSLHREFGPEFRVTGSALHSHQTPTGAKQQFLYCWCRVNS